MAGVFKREMLCWIADVVCSASFGHASVPYKQADSWVQGGTPIPLKFDRKYDKMSSGNRGDMQVTRRNDI